MICTRTNVIGRGLLAHAFARGATIPDAIVVAAGVSDSSCASEAEFSRERALVELTLAQAGDRLVFYFGSCGVVSEQLLAMPYYRHKLEMERLLSESGRRYSILRLPQIVGRGANRKTLVNYFYTSVREGAELDIQRDARRYFIDLADVVTFACHVARNPELACHMIDVACPHAYSPLDLLRAIESATGRAARFRLVEGGVSYTLSPEVFRSRARELAIDLGTDYLSRSVWRHFAAGA